MLKWVDFLYNIISYLNILICVKCILKFRRYALLLAKLIGRYVNALERDSTRYQ